MHIGVLREKAVQQAAKQPDIAFSGEHRRVERDLNIHTPLQAAFPVFKSMVLNFNNAAYPPNEVSGALLST